MSRSTDLATPLDVGGDRRNALERFLGLFSDVHAGEGLVVVALFANLFLILTSYYLIKVVREPLVLTTGGTLGLSGPQIKSYAAGGEALLLLGLVPLYGRFASRVDRRRLLNTVTLIFVGCLVAFFLAAQVRIPVGLAFFVWQGMFNVLVIAQFWSFANDVYGERQGKRLFPIVAAGGTLGAIAGSALAGLLVARFGPFPLMLVAAALLVASLALTNWVHHRQRAVGEVATLAGESRPVVEDRDAPLDRQGGFGLVFRHRYLLLVAVMTLVYNTVNTTGEFILSSVVTQKAAAIAAVTHADPAQVKQRVIGQLYAGFFTWVNVVSALLQLLVVSRVIKHTGVRGALLFLPVLALGSYGLIVAAPILPLVRAAKIAENSTDYSLQNTTRQTLFLPTSRVAKYKAKAAIDTFFVRFGDVVSALLVLAGSAVGLALHSFALVNVALVGVWLVLAVAIGRRYQQRRTA